MGVRENNRGRRDRRKHMEPVCSAIDHDAGVVVADQQRTVTPVTAGTQLDSTARAEECQFKCLCSCLHFVPRFDFQR